MQNSRLFEIVYILLSRKRVTAKELAERFEVSIRTIYRDIDVLSAAGVPVYAMQGAGGGICLDEDYVLNKSTLTDDEQAQILVALKSMAAAEHPEAGTLLSRLGSLFDKDSASWIEVDFSRWGIRSHDQRILTTLKEAIVGRRVLAFTYFSFRGESTRVVSPMKLTYKARAWYLQAFCHTRQAFRTFKLFRMTDIALTDETFDLSALPPLPPLEQSDSWPTTYVDVVLRFHPSILWRVLDEFDPSGAQWNEDGSITLRAWLPEDDQLHSYLLSFGAQVDVLAPEPLRRSLALYLQEILRKYDA